jgi:ribosome-binding protein aMBF1 (putative translation factor)
MQQPIQDWKPMVLNKSTSTTNSKKGTTGTQTGLTKKERELLDSNDAKSITLLSRNIVSQLIAARVAKGFTQQQVAKNLNIDVKIIKDIETFKYKNDMALAQRIARSLGVTKLVK